VSYIFLLFAIFFVYFAFIHDALAERRSHSWSCTEGTVEIVQEHDCSEDGLQTYYCTYIFRVDGVRQGGVFAISERTRLLNELQRALVGQAVTVRYNPNDCTECRIEESSLRDYTVSNSTI